MKLTANLNYDGKIICEIGLSSFDITKGQYHALCSFEIMTEWNLEELADPILQNYDMLTAQLSGSKLEGQGARPFQLLPKECVDQCYQGQTADMAASYQMGHECAM